MSFMVSSSYPSKHDAKLRAMNIHRKLSLSVFSGATSLETSQGRHWIRIALLGKGTFGSVFLVKTTNQESFLPHMMAVKSTTMDKSSSLKHEKRILSQLYHSPYVIRCYGDEITYMANNVKVYNLLLEYCSGLSMADHIILSRIGLPEYEVKLYARDILRGLKYIHQQGYIHCDIKPDNILLTPGSGERSGTFVAKLGDFGLAQKADEECSRLKGTYRYMSPELIIERRAQYATDIWAFGCTVSEMICGKPAWECAQVEYLLSVISRTNLVPGIPRNASEYAKDFLRRCFIRSPLRRWTAHMLLQHPFLSIN